jgi:DNA-binding NarL/FixJ family response regulator
MHYKTNDDMLICELSFESLTIEVIAEKMEVSIAEVLTALQEYAVEFTHDMHKNELIKLLLKSGMTNNQVVKLAGFNASSVGSIKCQLGLAKKTPRSDKSFAERYQMVASLVSDGMTVTEACRNVRLSSRDYVKMKALG